MLNDLARDVDETEEELDECEADESADASKGEATEHAPKSAHAFAVHERFEDAGEEQRQRGEARHREHRPPRSLEPGAEVHRRGRGRRMRQATDRPGSERRDPRADRVSDRREHGGHDAARDAGQERSAERRHGSVGRLAEVEEPLDERRTEADDHRRERGDDHRGATT